MRTSLPVLLVLAACAQAPVETPIVSRERAWASALLRDHPLVGRTWDVKEQRFVEAGELAQALAAADDVLLGETHDNPDHHLLQAELVRALTSRGERPALAFEMIPSAKQPAIDAVMAGRPTPEALASAVDWDRSGWPSFAMYRPIFEAGLAAGLPVVAADLAKYEAKAVAFEGPAALPEDLRDPLAKDVLPEPLAREWAEEMRASHCGMLPDDALAPMVLAQRARDLRLANRLVAQPKSKGTILIAGHGHVRTDRAVPAWIARLAPERKVVAVAMREVSAEQNEPGALPFDFVIFTPAMERGDPCEAMRKHHRRSGGK